jgi:RNA polymerase-interacting CarD/CdnL/TRCF family regulator
MAEKANQVAIGDGNLHVGDRVVYPNQGICRITGVATKTISGLEIEMVTLSREEDSATVMVPKAKVMGIGLRKVADVAAIDKVFDELTAPGSDPQLDWKVRHRENAERMSGGGLFGTVEVLRSLHTLSRVRPLPPKERELYDNARHLLVGEIAAAMNIPLHVAEDNLDYALWPPEGMKRKGRELPPATLGPPTTIRAAGDEDDLGFEDEEQEEEAETPAAAAEGEEEEGEEEGAPKKAPKAKAGAKAEPKSAATPAKPAAALPKPAAAPPKPAAAPPPMAHSAPLPAAPRPKAAEAHKPAPPREKPAAHERPAAHEKPVPQEKAAAAKKAAPAAAKKKAAPPAAAKKVTPAKKPAAPAKKPAAKAKPKGKR